jgi:hypothetical protein
MKELLLLWEAAFSGESILKDEDLKNIGGTRGR